MKGALMILARSREIAVLAVCGLFAAAIVLRRPSVQGAEEANDPALDRTRKQVRMLDDTLRQHEAPPRAQEDLQRIRIGLDEAHTELRELLNNFRAPMDERGMIPALDKLVSRFRQEVPAALESQAASM